MKELSAVTTTMSSTEIAKLTGKEKTNIHRDVKSQILIGLYGLKDDSYLNDNKIQGVTVVLDNRDYWSEVLLDKYHTDILISGYEVKYRAAIVKRWHELEHKNQDALPDFPVPKTFSEALKLAYEQSVVIDQQKHQIEEKDLYIVASNEASIKAGEILVREFVKSNDLIQIGQNEFYEWMREQGILLKNRREPDQKYVKRGYFTYKPSEEMHGGKFRYTLRITPRGKIWLARKYLDYLDSDITA
jgi:anti-repressor protein